MAVIDKRSILIVTEKNRILDSLQALLRTLPGVNVIGQVEERIAALEMISQDRPDLLLVVTSLPQEEAWAILERLRNDLLPRRLVLTDTLAKKKRALSLGVDEVLLTGFQATELFESIERILTEEN